MQDFVLTSESVTAGHPDKLCDQISDAIVDATLADSRPVSVSAECAVANGVVFLSVNRTEPSHVDLAETARGVIGEVGYVDGEFSADRCTVLTNTSISTDGDDWADPLAVRASRAITAFGFACRHNREMMPYAIWSAHLLTRALDAARRTASPDYLLPDGQAQVAVRFAERKPTRIERIVLTTAVDSTAPADTDNLHSDLVQRVVEPAFDNAEIGPCDQTRIVVRRASPSPTGGPASHAGLTGRKIADDNYGGYSRQTATALSGKDPSRVDRIAAYAARHLAKCVVAAGLADECEVQLSYAIGESLPLSFELDTFGTGTAADARLSARLLELFDLRVGAVVERLDLWRLVQRHDGRFYRDLAVYGHFGRGELDAPWEDTSDAARI